MVNNTGPEKASQEDDQGFPEPELLVSEDGLEIRLNWDLPDQPPGDWNELATLILTKLKALKVHEAPDLESLSRWLEQTTEKNASIQYALLMEGQRPVPPKHGRVKWAGDYFNTGFRITRSTGAVDFRRIAAQVNVEKGQCLGKRKPAQDGEGGVDIFGKAIPGEQAQLFYPRTGENVRYDEKDESYYADISGRIRLFGDTVSVDSVFHIRGSVGMETGNIEHNGSVIIGKDILEGAVVWADGDIEVMGVIEAAEVRTRGNLVVHGGITRSTQMAILAGGSINAKYILDSKVTAGRDVIVKKEILNSRVETLGAVVVPHGRIVGGSIQALRGITVGQINTRAYVPTLLETGIHFALERKIKAKELELRAMEEDLRALQEGAARNLGQDRQSADRQPADRQSADRDPAALKEEMQALRVEIEDLHIKARARAQYDIKVQKALYRATKIRMGTARLELLEDEKGPLCVRLQGREIVIEKK